MLIDQDVDIPITRQCGLLGLSRSSVYYRPQRDVQAAVREQVVLNAIDELYTARPHLGRRGMTDALAEEKQIVSSSMCAIAPSMAASMSEKATAAPTGRRTDRAETKCMSRRP